MKLSQEKRDKITEQVLSILFHNFPKSLFTAEIAREIARDEEFIKDLMIEISNKGLITAIKKNAEGADYSRRIKWRISNPAYEAYKQNIIV